MRYTYLILLASAMVVGAQTRTVMVDTNGVVVYPTNSTLTLSHLVMLGGSLDRVIDIEAETNSYDDLVFPITTLNPPGTESAATLVASSGPSGDQLALVFVANNVFLVAPQMSHTWTPGTTIFPHLHFMPQTTAALTNKWRISYAVADINGMFPTSTIVTNNITITAGSEQWEHKLVNVPTNGIPMTGKTGPSTEVLLRYTLLATSGDTHVISFDIHYHTGGTPVIYTP